ncbi:hypothetical protein FLA_1955 [Filimonas lacunae]|nr:hypothetical protein FLA_1955 [Filimonas lacunae]
MLSTFNVPFSATQKWGTWGFIKKPSMCLCNFPLMVDVKGLSFDNTI